MSSTTPLVSCSSRSNFSVTIYYRKLRPPFSNTRIYPTCSSNFSLRSNLCTFSQKGFVTIRVKTKISDAQIYPTCSETISLGSGVSLFAQKGFVRIPRNLVKTKDSGEPVLEEEEVEMGKNGNGGSSGGGEERDWTTSFLLFLLWGGLLFYVFRLAPNQTPSMDMYFLKKLLFLAGDDGFKMNEVVVSLWNIMGLWPLLYTMLLLPTGRSSKGNVPVWPFLTLSCFLGAYVLIPYFILWRPPPPPIKETELRGWPLKLFQSKLTAGIALAAGGGLILNAGLADAAVWKEFFQYFNGSRLIHVTSLDFTLLSVFAPFWVYNDMSARKWYDKGFWLLPLSVVPFLGPALYVLLRPPVPAIPESISKDE